MPQEIQVYVVGFRWTKTSDMDYDTFTDSDNLIEVCKLYADKWCFQLEKTIREDGSDNLHYQGYMKLKEKQRPKTFAIKLNDEFLGINFQACSAAGKEALNKYCMKSDTRVAGPWCDHPVYMGADLPTTLAPWQTNVVNMIARQPHPRRIYWMYDPVGSCGKSIFAKYMAFHHGVLKLTFANAESLLYTVATNPPNRTYFFDLCRTRGQQSSMGDIFQAIESVKDGHFISSKYESKSVMFDRPHVFVFSNKLPKLCSMSADRWVVYEVSLPPEFQRNDDDNLPEDTGFVVLHDGKRRRID